MVGVRRHQTVLVGVGPTVGGTSRVGKAVGSEVAVSAIASAAVGKGSASTTSLVAVSVGEIELPGCGVWAAISVPKAGGVSKDAPGRLPLQPAVIKTHIARITNLLRLHLKDLTIGDQSISGTTWVIRVRMARSRSAWVCA